jgi:ankyrin repeat protein
MRMTHAWRRLLSIGLAVALFGGGGIGLPLAHAADGNPDLIAAARSADWVALRSLLDAGADANAVYGDGTTALHWASHWDHLESADLLIRAGADVNAANDLGATPLWSASLNGSAAMVRRLLAAGANPNAALLLGETVVMTAARSGSAEVVRLLLAAGADPNAHPERKEVTPCLFDAERTCSVQAGGQTALMWAVAQHHADVVEVLLDYGADIHARPTSTASSCRRGRPIRFPRTSAPSRSGATRLCCSRHEVVISPPHDCCWMRAPTPTTRMPGA